MAFVSISKLVITENEHVIKNHKIVATLLAKFFLFLLKYPIFIIEDKSNQLTILAITEEKIQNAIFQAKLLKKARYNCIFTLVWQKSYLILKDFIILLF